MSCPFYLEYVLYVHIQDKRDMTYLPSHRSTMSMFYMYIDMKRSLF